MSKYFTPEINRLVDQQEDLKGQLDQLTLPRDLLLEYVKIGEMVRDYMALEPQQFIEKHILGRER